MAGPTRDGGTDSDEPLDDATVAERWAELTRDLGELHVPTDDELRATPAEPEPPRRVPAPGPRDYEPGPGTDDDEDPSSGVDGFVPPDPDPFSHSDPALALGWVATVGSLLVGLILLVVNESLPTWVLLTLAATLLGGIGLLLWRMPAGPDDRGPGDGAVV
ncbi:hypothetical protein [Georgenia sp. SUBG003]|uniref:hypothetical protein n=1 Tax=Georgenia sp. SUBG003 TaxID=1497974 RepID=UPI0006935E3E